MFRSACVRELDADRAAVACVAAPNDEAVLLEPVDMPREGRALDVKGARELVLRPPRCVLEIRQDEPHRHRAADPGECVVESPSDMLGGVGELEPDRDAGRAHGRSVAF